MVLDAVVERHPQLADPQSLEAFKRKWIYMFEYAAAGYAKAYTALGCWTFARPVRPSAAGVRCARILMILLGRPIYLNQAIDLRRVA